MKGSFIGVGENIHCTRIRLTAGKFVETLADGRAALCFKDGGRPAHLPVPEAVRAGEEWGNGRVRHVAVAIWQGLHGSEADRAAGIAYLQAMAREQEANGAHFLDLNVDEFSRDLDEKRRAVAWTAGVVQAASTLPLSIDSSTPEILEAGMAACDAARGKPLVNSVSLERAGAIAIAAAAGAKVIAGAGGAASMPEGIDDRLANLDRLLAMLRDAGYGLGDVYLDPLVFPVSVAAANGTNVLTSIRALREKLGPAVHFAPGLSNVSFGLPKRNVINLVFTALCREAGCDGGIVDPLQINDRTLAGLDRASEAFALTRNLLLGQDEFGVEFLAASRDGRI